MGEATWGENLELEASLGGERKTWSRRGGVGVNWDWVAGARLVLAVQVD